MCLECVPSDKLQISQEALVRLQPMVAPMMHRCDVTFHTFFVPSRILWPNFDKWITNQKIAGNLPAYPTISLGSGMGLHDVTVGSLMDYFGLPLTDATYASPEDVSALPLAAYQMIYNEYYRDQNMISPVDFELVDGNNTFNNDLYVKRKRAWEHDYFTAASPTAQAGDAVSIPVLQNFDDVQVRINQANTPGGAASIASGFPPNPVLIGWNYSNLWRFTW